jgi:predicted GNAT family N-acyltransferase
MNAPVPIDKDAKHQRIAAPRFTNELEVTVARTLNELIEVVALRSIVYIGEQQCPFEEEVDGNDFAGATHLLLRARGEPVGTLRLRWFADFAKLERVAVRKEHRGGRGTRVLIDAAFDLAARKGYRKMLGHAQARLTPFWKRYHAHPRADRPRFVFSDHEYVEIEAELRVPDDALNADSDPIVLLRPEGAWDHPGVLDHSTARPATNPHVRKCAH